MTAAMLCTLLINCFGSPTGLARVHYLSRSMHDRMRSSGRKPIKITYMCDGVMGGARILT